MNVDINLTETELLDALSALVQGARDFGRENKRLIDLKHSLEPGHPNLPAIEATVQRNTQLVKSAVKLQFILTDKLVSPVNAT